ncbi:hypothetical protein [Arthrobacter sp. JUb115]|uniref:hypothetical protein n=1 Tax=Arthrobacter sp. JUb115 TaxID=2485108 RepID=UPI0010EDB2C0|nr:hypothetical protein [Arthrobacter sp. JUb115]TDU24450.1 hypothetical protein EDF61_1072 [Arthrobacter sp. JUb115]
MKRKEAKTIQTTAKDTGETATVPTTVDRDMYDEGNDWMESLAGTGWHEVPGWDLGFWPYIIFAAAKTEDAAGKLFGYTTYVEGDVTARWYRSREARNLAISKEAFWYWARGQPDGPEALEGMNSQEFQPIDGLCEPYIPNFGN